MKKENPIEKIRIREDDVYMKKSFDGWRVVYPFKNEDGTLNWKTIFLGGNFGTFIKMLVICIIIILFIYFYFTNFQSCAATVKEHIASICNGYQSGNLNVVDNIFNLTISNGTG